MERSDKEPRQGDPRAPQELSISSPKAKPVAPPPPPKPPKKPGGKRVPIDVALQQVARDGSLATDAGTSSRTHLSVAPNDAAQAREDTNLAQIEQHEVYNKLSPRHSNGAEEPTSPAIHPKSSHSNGYSNPFDEDVEEGQANKKLPPTKPLVKQEESAVVRMRKANLHFTNSTVAPRVTGGEPNNMIYHKSRLSEGWVIGAVFLLILQMSFLLGIGYDALPVGTLVVLLFLIVVIVGLFIRTRLWVRKSRMSNMRNIKLRGGICTPDDEADVVPDKAVYCLVWASLLLGIVYSVFTAVAAGNGSQLQQDGFQSQETVLQVLRFSSIVLLAFHRTLRPANRIDPLRTVLELEVVSVCWDALDGSTLYELLENKDLPTSIDNAIRLLMGFWYLSVGGRVAVMFLTHLTPTSRGYNFVLPPPLALDPQPTVDRTLQGLRLRSIVIIIMAVAEFYAAAVRIIVWTRGQLDPLQQDLLIKNLLFLSLVYKSYDLWKNTIVRQWNSRSLPFGFRYPGRATQLEMFRWSFVAFYILESALLTSILVNVTDDSFQWMGNLAMDVLLILFFLLYCRNVHIHEDHCFMCCLDGNPLGEPRSCFWPKPHFFSFPGHMAAALSTLMACSMFVARVPALYYNFGNMAPATSHVIWTYDNSMLVVTLSIVPIGLCSMFWSISYMLFRKEFTASPGNYNSIHDPSIYQVSIATMTEGALDVLSAATLMQVAEFDLSPAMDGAVSLFVLLELLNACQSFALQTSLSGGTLVLRLILWIQYNATNGVFLVKNLYNLMHTAALMERWRGVRWYPKHTQFSEYVAPADWYGLSKEQWRVATSETLALQARAGRGI